LILSNQIKLFSLKPNLSIFDLEKIFAPVAQWIEQKFPKLLVGGSIPLGGTENIEIKKGLTRVLFAIVYKILVLFRTPHKHFF
jgi:hypothetical protein